MATPRSASSRPITGTLGDYSVRSTTTNHSHPRGSGGGGGGRGNGRHIPSSGFDLDYAGDGGRSEGQISRGGGARGRSQGRGGGTRGRGGRGRGNGRSSNGGNRTAGENAVATGGEGEGRVQRWIADTGNPGSGSDAGADDGLSPAELAKEAKIWAKNLGELLKTKAPWEQPVESLRLKIRARYKTIYLRFPTSPAAQTIDSLWIFTSHTLIGAYRILIAEYEKKVDAFMAQRGTGAARGRGGYGSNGGGRGGGHAGEGALPGPVEMRKLLGRFRTFLGNEKGFYKRLVRDIVDAFALSAEVGVYLEALEIPLGDNQRGDTSITPSNRYRQASAPRGTTPTGRRTPQATTSPPPEALTLTREEIQKKIGMVHKALICLGDLERYREQYGSEREKKMNGGGIGGNGNGKGGKGLKGDGGEAYGGAKRYYEVARGLLPENGNPSNQLAVISSYCQDTFSAIYHYFRALVVQQPFTTAEYNLAKTLRKALHDWEAARRQEGGEDGRQSFGRMVVGNELGSLKREEVVMQAMVYTMEDPSGLPSLVAEHLDHFAALLTDRQIPSEIIVKTVVLAIMSNWHAKINQISDAPAGSTVTDAKTVTIEYLLSLIGVLLEVGNDELAIEMGQHGLAHYEDETSVSAAPVFEDEDDVLALHQHISAVFRRMLPPLRIFSKWLKTNHDQVKALLEDQSPSTIMAGSTVQQTAETFWHTYFDFLGRLEWLFPIEQLPKLCDTLEEDHDMRGLSPLQRGMATDFQPRPMGNDIDGEDRGRKRLLSDVHPNEEQLMRVSDLLIDGKMLLQGEVSKVINPGRFARRVFTVPAEAVSTQLEAAGRTPPARPHITLPTEQTLLQPPGAERSNYPEADMASVSTETEDDPVNLAMRATMMDGSSLADDEERSMLAESDEDEEEKMIWTAAGNAFNPPAISSATAETATNSASPLVQAAAPPPITAQSLLHSMLNAHAGQSAGFPSDPRLSAAAGVPPQSENNIWLNGNSIHPNGVPASADMSYSPSSGRDQAARNRNSSGSFSKPGLAGTLATNNSNPWGPPSSPSVARNAAWGGLGNGTSSFGTPIASSIHNANISGNEASGGASSGFSNHTQYLNNANSGATVDGLPQGHLPGNGGLPVPGMTLIGAGVIGQGFTTSKGIERTGRGSTDASSGWGG